MNRRNNWKNLKLNVAQNAVETKLQSYFNENSSLVKKDRGKYV